MPRRFGPQPVARPMTPAPMTATFAGSATLARARERVEGAVRRSQEEREREHESDGPRLRARDRGGETFDHRPRPDERVPRVPAPDAAEIDAEGAERQSDSDECPAGERAGCAPDDRMHQEEADEAEQEPRRRDRPAQ